MCSPSLSTINVRSAKFYENKKIDKISISFSSCMYSLASSSSITTQILQSVKNKDMGDVQRKLDDLRKLMNFKKFDSVLDFSDHFCLEKQSSAGQLSNSWMKKMQLEWKLLESALPEGIYVRVSESRMDLLRAVIIGTAGTPYHYGLFFFDVWFPPSYPNEPPIVCFHSHGLCNLNPNLMGSGGICLSLLNTMASSPNEMWCPNMSTMLQVLVSFQALVLNANPYFNEEGEVELFTDPKGNENSRKFNRYAFIESLKLMNYIIKNPPQHFEDLVVGHFRARELDIAMACFAYSEGAEVGCNVKEWFEESENVPKSGSESFKKAMKNRMKYIIKCLAYNRSSDNGVQEVSQSITELTL